MTRDIRKGMAMLVVIIAILFVSNCAAELSSPAQMTPQTQEFYRIARRELAVGKGCADAVEYVRGLPPEQQLEVARVIVNDPDAQIGYAGANLLIERGRAEESAPALAAIIASGRDETQLNGRIGYEWVHSEDQTLFLRMAILINRYLLANLEKYQGQERVRVERVLMGGLLEPPSMPFSRKEAEKHISDWEAALAKTKRQ